MLFYVGLQKSTPIQIRQLIVYISKSKGLVVRFLQELTLAKQLHKHFLWVKFRVFGSDPTVEYEGFVGAEFQGVT